MLFRSVNEKQFYYWQSRLRTIASESLPDNGKQSKFVPLVLPTSQSTDRNTFSPAMVIKLGEAAIELASDTQPELLASVLKVLKDAQ